MKVLPKQFITESFDFTTDLAKGVRKVACSLATIASHRVAEVTQAPIAGPLAPIIIGLGQSKNWSNTAWLLLEHGHSKVSDMVKDQTQTW